MYVRKSPFTAPLVRRRKTKFLTVYPTIYTSPNEKFKYSYPLNEENGSESSARFTSNVKLNFPWKQGWYDNFVVCLSSPKLNTIYQIYLCRPLLKCYSKLKCFPTYYTLVCNRNHILICFGLILTTQWHLATLYSFTNSYIYIIKASLYWIVITLQPRLEANCMCKWA